MKQNREFLDQIDILQIEQLHQVVLQLSKNCFEIKKWCLTILMSAMILVTSFTSQQIDFSHFAGAGIIVIFFYLLDVQSYYYQEKVRIRMKDIVSSMAQRKQEYPQVIALGMPIKEVSQSVSKRIRHALFNTSMLFYGALALIILFVLVLYQYGTIESYWGSWGLQ